MITDRLILVADLIRDESGSQVSVSKILVNGSGLVQGCQRLFIVAFRLVFQYFRVFREVIASARDERLKPLYPREWDLVYIGIPKVNKRKQHRPTLLGEEMTHIVTDAKGKYQIGAALLAGCGARISELLALQIEKHISDDRSTLFIRQQRGKKGGIKHTLKTDAAYRDIDLHSALAKMLSDFIGDRKEGFLFQTATGNMLSPESFYRDGLKTIFKRMDKPAFASTHSADSVSRYYLRPRVGNF